MCASFHGNKVVYVHVQYLEDIHDCVTEIIEMLSYKNNKYDKQEVFSSQLLCFPDLEATLTVPSA